MSNHIWRQGHNIDPMREWMRRELPGSRDGVVLIDLDLAVRRYGNKRGLDSKGDLLLIEKKEYEGEVTWGEKYVYDWIDDAVANSHKKDKWRGWYVLRVVYKNRPCICEQCGQPAETDDDAFIRFSNAKLYLDEEEISHEFLRKWLIDNKVIDND